MIDRTALLVLWLLATLMLVAGLSMLLSGAPVFAMATEFPTVQSFFGYFLEFGLAFALAGGLALYLTRPHGLLLPNEREEVREDERPQLNGWLIGLAIFLVASPIFLVIELQPLRSEWERVIALLVMSGMFENMTDPQSGIIVIPVLLALTPAAIEYAGMMTFIGVSAVLLPPFLLRSPLFPRLFLVGIVMLAGFAVASIRAADATIFTSNANLEFLQNSDASPEEEAQAGEIAGEIIGQHVEIVTSTARALSWIFVGYIIWLPMLSISRQARKTFATRWLARSSAAGAPDIESITRPPRR